MKSKNYKGFEIYFSNPNGSRGTQWVILPDPGRRSGKKLSTEPYVEIRKVKEKSRVLQSSTFKLKTNKNKRTPFYCTKKQFPKEPMILEATSLSHNLKIAKFDFKVTMYNSEYYKRSKQNISLSYKNKDRYIPMPLVTKTRQNLVTIEAGYWMKGQVTVLVDMLVRRTKLMTAKGVKEIYAFHEGATDRNKKAH